MEEPHPTPTKLGIGECNPGSLILPLQHIDLRDDSGKTMSAINGLDGSKQVLSILEGSQKALKYKFTSASLPIFRVIIRDRHLYNTRKQFALLSAETGVTEPHPEYHPIIQGYQLNRNIKRRPKQRPLSSNPQKEIDKQFATTSIQEGDAADTKERRQLARRLAYIQRDYFTFNLTNIVTTDLITHSINLIPEAVPFHLQQPQYTRNIKAFTKRFYNKLQRAG